jgi:hypothetical protein
MKLPDIVVESAAEEEKAKVVKEEKKESVMEKEEKVVVKTSSRPSTPASTRSTRKNQNGNTPRESSIKEQDQEEMMKISSPEPQSSKRNNKRGRSVTPKKEIDEEELDQIIEEEEGKSPAKKKKRSNSRAQDEEKEKEKEQEEEREDGEIDENQSIPNSSRPVTPLPVFTAKINRSSLRSSSKSSLKFEDEEEEDVGIIQPEFKKNNGEDGKQWHWICSDCLTVQGKQLLQQEIQVWWLDDYCVYYGTVDAFDEISSSHRVLYQDEEWEFLDLSSQAFLISYHKAGENNNSNNIMQKE